MDPAMSKLDAYLNTYDDWEAPAHTQGGHGSGETAGASLFAGCDTLEALRGCTEMGNRVWQCVHGRPA
jgi:hypothetical protein